MSELYKAFYYPNLSSCTSWKDPIRYHIGFLPLSEEPVELTSGLQDVVVSKLHDVAEFRLKVSKADCKVSWLCGTTSVVEGPKYTVGIDDLEPYLKVNDVTGKDEGPFTVKVDDLTSTAKLVVQGKKIQQSTIHYYFTTTGWHLMSFKK